MRTPLRLHLAQRGEQRGEQRRDLVAAAVSPTGVVRSPSRTRSPTEREVAIRHRRARVTWVANTTSATIVPITAGSSPARVDWMPDPMASMSCPKRSCQDVTVSAMAASSALRAGIVRSTGNANARCMSPPRTASGFSPAVFRNVAIAGGTCSNRLRSSGTCRLRSQSASSVSVATSFTAMSHRRGGAHLRRARTHRAAQPPRHPRHVPLDLGHHRRVRGADRLGPVRGPDHGSRQVAAGLGGSDRAARVPRPDRVRPGGAGRPVQQKHRRGAFRADSGRRPLPMNGRSGAPPRDPIDPEIPSWCSDWRSSPIWTWVAPLFDGSHQAGVPIIGVDT